MEDTVGNELELQLVAAFDALPEPAKPLMVVFAKAMADKRPAYKVRQEAMRLRTAMGDLEAERTVDRAMRALIRPLGDQPSRG